MDVNRPPLYVKSRAVRMRGDRVGVGEDGGGEEQQLVASMTGLASGLRQRQGQPGGSIDC